MKEIAFLLCVFGPSSLVALIVWQRRPRLWWACLGVLAMGVGAVLYLPVRFAFHTPASEFDGFAIYAEFLVFACFAVVVHLGFLLASSLLWIEKILERKKAASKTESRNEVSGYD